jgi:hypothetical protein
MSFKKFDQEILTPYESSGDRAREFNQDKNVFTYTQVRYMAIQSYKHALNSNQPPNTQIQTDACDHDFVTVFDLTMYMEQCAKCKDVRR